MDNMLDKLLGGYLAEFEDAGLSRTMKTVQSTQGRTVTVGGRKLLSWASNSYLGLADDPAVVAAARDALDRWGYGSASSRLIIGNMAPHEELEQAVARFKGREAAALYPTGYSVNVGLIPALCRENDVIFSDSSNHSSMIDGMRLSRARRVVFRHNDPSDLEDKLKSTACDGTRFVMTESLYSMEGDVSPLGDVVRLAKEHGAVTMIDDAHGTGTLGPRGRGGEEHFGITGQIDVVMGTLSKALGGLGGFVAGGEALRRFQVNASRTFIYSTALPPVVAAAGIAAIEVLEKDSTRLEKLRANIRRLRKRLEALGFGFPPDETPIFLVTIGDEELTMKLGARFTEAGMLVPPVRYPTVPLGAAAVRVSVSALHTEEDIDRLADEFESACSDFGIEHEKQRGSRHG